MALKEEYGDKIAFIIADLREDEARQLASEFNVSGIPACYFIDETGEVIFKKAGAASFEEMQEIILEKLLK